MTEAEAARWLQERDNFLILTHTRPDGDTLGSAAALCAGLKKLGKTAWVAPNGGVTATYQGDITPYFAPDGYAFDHIVAVDVASEGLFRPEMEGYKGKVALCIDHHPSNEHYAPHLCLDPTAAACGEIIFRILHHHLHVMDEEIARAVYLAVSTDTGCFVYNNTTPETHRIAGAVMEYGDFAKEINKRCFQTKSRKRIALESRLLSGAVYYHQEQVVIGAVSCADMEAVQAGESDAEELSSLLRLVEGVKAAATLRELSPGKWKLSLRTDADYLNATRTCAALGGGGHAAAAGATLRGSFDEQQAREMVLQAIEGELG